MKAGRPRGAWLLGIAPLYAAAAVGVHLAHAARAAHSETASAVQVQAQAQVQTPVHVVSRNVGVPSAPAAPWANAAAKPTLVTMRNVEFLMGDGIALRIVRLDGDMEAARNGVVDFDDRESYVTHVQSAEVGLSGDALTHLMNDHVFAYRGSPLRHLHIDIRDGLLHQKGILHKGVDIPFDMDARVSLTEDQKLRLEPVRMKILGVDGLKLMRALHLSLERMLDVSGAKGVTVRGNDMFIDPLVVLPPPRITGHIASVQLADGVLWQTFGGADTTPVAPPPSSDAGARNYMHYRGGTLHFGKLFMADADMLVLDADPQDAFEFDNVHYQRQLVAGYSRTLQTMGLEVHMPDASKVTAANRQTN